MFYSIQGEGPYVGYPRIFIRLSGCNLHCGVSSDTIVNANVCGWSQNAIEAAQIKEANWVCDTISVWLLGKEYTNEELYNELDKNGWLSHDYVGFVFTGGEPLLQDAAIISFIEYLSNIPHNRYGIVEVETNGTLIPSEELSKRVYQFNVSPKLSNSGMSLEKRMNPEAIVWHNANIDSTFKFVVVNEADIKEVNELCDKYDIRKRATYLMPGASTREELIRNSKQVVEWCKQYGYRYSSRLQLEIWDKKTGV
jgi:organic radical activating enzyme